MSQAGELDVIASHPEIPTLFVCNVGSAVPAANTLNVFGEAVTAVGIPVETVGSGNTIEINVQYASAQAASSATHAGLASFDSTEFGVDANGFVTTSGIFSETLTGNSGGAVGPTAGNINTLGTGSITVVGNPGTSTLTWELTGLTNHAVQVGAGTATLTQLAVGTNGQVLIGATAADPAFATLTSSDGSITFTPGANSLSLQVTGGSTVGKTITGDSGGALSPTLGNWNIFGGTVVAGTTPVATSGAVSTLTINVQRSQAIAATDSTKIGLCNFDSAKFTVDANGFVSTSGTGLANTITGQSGGALSPTAGNWNIYGGTSAAGTSPVVTSGSGSTLTTNVQISQAIAATDATKIGLCNFDSSAFGVDANGFVTMTGSMTIAWSDKNANFNAVKQNGYFCTAALTATLPGSPAEGDTISVICTTTAIVIQANTGQVIALASTSSTTAGTATNTSSGDSLTIVFRSTSSTWRALSAIGNWSLA